MVDFCSFGVFKILFKDSFSGIALMEVDFVSDIALDGAVIVKI